MTDLADILADLHAESAELDALVADLDEAGWRLPTPAPGWSIAHQIAHLNWTDRVATRSATDPDGFLAELGATATDPDGFVDRAAREHLAPPAELLARWRADRAALAAALTAAPGGRKLPWFAVWMSPASMATGRMMETWAHGCDVADALGVRRRPTARLRHVVFLGVRTLPHGFATRGRPVPDEPVYVELTAPDGGTWAYGPADTANRVTGPAEDFCRLVTRRAHRDDLALVATGPVADEWLSIAQAFAGPPGPDPLPTGAATGRG